MIKFLTRWLERALSCRVDVPFAAEIIGRQTGTQTICAAPASGWLRGRFLFAARAQTAFGTMNPELWVGSSMILAATVGSNAWLYSAAPLGVAPGPLNNVALVRNNDLAPLHDARSAGNLAGGPLYALSYLPQEHIIAPGECARWLTNTASAAQLNVRFQGTQTT